MQPETHTEKFDIKVVYNGETRPVATEPHQAVKALLQHAIKTFGLTDRIHVLALFLDNIELTDESKSVADSGITPRSVLQLRPSTVKGGAA